MRFVYRAGACALTLSLAAGCSMPRQAPDAAPPAPAAAQAPAQPEPCRPAGQSPLVGNWYSVSKQAGIKGEMRRLLVLQEDGSFRSETRHHDGRNLRAELRETGCWETAGNTYTTRVTHSNGEAVDAGDPIYRNTYRVEKVGATQLVTREDVPGARPVTARKMPPGYRMP
ncbi:hypothetical protein V8Z80_20150 [Orrella sp. JC864]|uniref:hypothetical protein n=1 Tax=Orrella sp. JC864 TaxID=3120298 RepID=UPI00300BB7C3